MLKRTIENHNIKLHSCTLPNFKLFFISLTQTRGWKDPTEYNVLWHAFKTQTLCQKTKPHFSMAAELPACLLGTSMEQQTSSHFLCMRTQHTRLSKNVISKCTGMHTTSLKLLPCVFRGTWRTSTTEEREGKKFQNRNVLFYRMQNGKLLWGPAGSPTMNKNFIYWPRVQLYESSLSFTQCQRRLPLKTMTICQESTLQMYM